MRKSILIVGGSGFIAQNLIERFVKESFDVTVYGRNEPRVGNGSITFIQGGLDDIEVKLASFSCHRFSEIIYLVNSIPVNSDVSDYADRMDLNKRAIDFLCSITLRVVFFSSGGRVYKSSHVAHNEVDNLVATCLYGRSKIELESYVSWVAQKAGCKYLIVRPSNPYGKYQSLYSNQGLVAVTVGKILEGHPIEIWGSGREVRDYIYIDDLVDALFKLLSFDKLPYDVFNIGSGFGCSTLDVVTTILDVMGRKDIEFVNVDVHRELIPSNVLSIGRLYGVTGFKPVITLSDGVQKFLIHQGVI